MSREGGSRRDEGASSTLTSQARLCKAREIHAKFDTIPECKAWSFQSQHRKCRWLSVAIVVAVCLTSRTGQWWVICRLSACTASKPHHVSASPRLSDGSDRRQGICMVLEGPIWAGRFAISPITLNSDSSWAFGHSDL